MGFRLNNASTHPFKNNDIIYAVDMAAIHPTSNMTSLARFLHTGAGPNRPNVYGEGIITHALARLPRLLAAIFELRFPRR